MEIVSQRYNGSIKLWEAIFLEGNIKVPSKILGVYGGLGPAASAEFLRLLAQMAPAKVDQDHPVVYMYSNPQIPDRSSAIMGVGPSPEDNLRAGLTTLCSWGADLLAVPCNTAHFFIDRFRDRLGAPLVHIVEATVGDAVSESPSGSWLIATGGTMSSGIYQKEAEKRGYDLAIPPQKIQEDVEKCIAEVKGGDLYLAGEIMSNLVERLRSIRDVPVIGACTELPLAYDVSGLPSDGMISSLKALSKNCIAALYPGKFDKKRPWS